MKAFVQFTEINHMTHEIVEALGSDGIFTLDGRNNLDTMIQDAEKRRDQLRHVKPWYTGYRIYRGDLHNSRLIFSI